MKMCVIVSAWQLVWGRCFVSSNPAFGKRKLIPDKLSGSDSAFSSAPIRAQHSALSMCPSR